MDSFHRSAGCPSWRDLEDQAQLAYEAGDLESARTLLSQASVLTGAGQSVWANLGMVSLDLDDYLAAIDAYGKADQDAVQVRVNRGLAFERIGERDRARQEYLAALELQPSELDALVNLGTLELEAGQTERARTLLTRAVEIDPRTNWQLIDLWVSTGELDQAATTALRAIEAGEPRAYLDLARIERARNQMARSEIAYRRAGEFGVDGAAEDFSEFMNDHDTDAAR